MFFALTTGAAFAQDAATTGGGWAGGLFGGEKATKSFAYFLALGLAVYGGTSGQSRAAAVALEGIARNPSAADKIQTPMILALALMESLVIFALISTFLV
ncbi:MAG: ATP synthase F0 subunit C [Bacteriovorax sp.]